MEKYIKRIAEKIIEEFDSEIKCAILINGPKWCGKTFLARQYANFELEVAEFKNFDSFLLEKSLEQAIKENPTPILIDEWQENPLIWDVSKRIIDKSAKKGVNLILTGSSTPAYKNKISHSGVGRIFKIWLSTLTYDEINAFENKLSFKKLFEAKNDNEIKKIISDTVVDINYKLYTSLERIAYGCWPEIVANEIKNSKYAEKYAIDLTETNFRDINGLVPNKETTTLILRAMARLNATTMELSKIQTDLENNIARNTLEKYWEAFNSVSLLISLNARSKTQLRTKPKFYFCDPSIPAAILKLKTPEALLSDKRTLGFLFENLVMKDLMVYAKALGGELFYFRNNNDLEVDAIIQYKDRKWGAIEIKTGADEIDKAARNLLSFKEKFEAADTTIDAKPLFLMIVCGSISRTYIRDDGVIVCPPSVLGV